MSTERSKGGQAPPFQNPPSVRDVGGACGASLRVRNPCWANSGRRTHTQGEGRAYGIPWYLSLEDEVIDGAREEAHGD